MTEALTRIEFEYVMKTFSEIKPELYLSCGGKAENLAASDYSFDNLKISVTKKLNVLPGSKVIVLFFHRKRKMYFNSVLKNENGNFYIQIPDKIFKAEQDKGKPAFPNIKIFFGKDDVFTAEALNGFFGKDIEAEENTDSQTSSELLEAMKNFIPNEESLVAQKKILSLFLDSIKKTSQTELTPAFIFADSEFILIFCRKELAQKTANKELKMELNFPKRTVNCLGKHNFFCRTVEKSEKGFLSLKILAAEEDKRFLHELTHKTKYGQR